MEEIRKYHNESKRLLIQSATREGDSILDVGCGFITSWKPYNTLKISFSRKRLGSN